MMRIATFKGEQNLSELARRLFQLSECAPPAQLKQVEAALLRANPRLIDLRAVRNGAVIVVPDITGIEPAAETRQVNAVTGEVVEQVRQALSGLRESLAAAARREAEEGGQEIQFLQSSESEELAKRFGAFKTRLPNLTEAAKARVEAAEALKAFTEKAVSRLDKDLADLGHQQRMRENS